jgi:SulP family sulfate permease
MPGLQDHVLGTVFGFVNFVVCIPALVSYAHVVFPSAEFGDDLPALTKLFIFSSAIIQAVFTWMSRLPFAIGQIQDVGLIFLAAMVRSAGGSATLALVQCCTSTFCVGVGVFMLGRLRISQYIQMLPYPVVGGYLAYIGYFCLAAGLGISTDTTINGPSTWLVVLEPQLRPYLLVFAANTLVLCLVQYYVSDWLALCRLDRYSALAMPIALIALPFIFFVTAPSFGVDVQHGLWLSPPAEQAAGINTFQLYVEDFDFNKSLHLFIHNIANLVGLFIVVSFGSSLDVAAIQAGCSTKLDFDNEIMTIGVSNLASGLLGGFTGSYIFSQTLFSQKKGVASPVNGLVVCIGELVLFFSSVDLMSYMPLPYVGSVMALFGIDIMYDWLIKTYHQVDTLEYALLWLTFIVIWGIAGSSAFGLIEGMTLGSLAAACFFGCLYAQQPCYSRVFRYSSQVRAPRQRQVLNSLEQQLFVCSLQGYLFFGNSTQLRLNLAAELQSLGASVLILDFTNVMGLDCTAAQSVASLKSLLDEQGVRVYFAALGPLADRLRVFDALESSVAGLGSETLEFTTLNAAIMHVENIMLDICVGGTVTEAAAVASPASTGTLTDFILEENAVITDNGPSGLRPVASFAWSVPDDSSDACAHRLAEFLVGYPSNGSQSPPLCPADNEVLMTMRMLAEHFKFRSVPESALLFRHNDKADSVFVVASGTLHLSGEFPQPNRPPADESSVTDKAAVVAGTILGDIAFAYGATYGYHARSGHGGCCVWHMSRRQVQELENVAPNLAIAFWKIVARDMALYTVQHFGSAWAQPMPLRAPP